MYKKLLYFVFLFVTFRAVSQNDSNVVFAEGHISEKQECIPTELRQKINAYLAENIKKYRFNSTRTQAHPLFSFPLRKITTLSDFSYFTIFNFVDHNSAVGPNSFNQYTSTNQDYTCGNRTYDTNGGYNHAGVDIALFPYDWQKMKENAIEVVASAPGVIIGKYDGNSSFSCGSSTQPYWNAVFVQHADNSVAWYGHLKQGTLTLKAVGSTVEQGEYLGVVGSSGNSTGPHLHLEVYDSNNQLIDPYFGTCNPSITESWWQNQAPYLDKTLNVISTHQVQPITGQCPYSNNKVNYSYNIRKSYAGYFYLWGRQIQLNDVVNFSLIRPNGTAAVTSNSSANNYYLTFYFSWLYYLNSSEPSGIWKVRTVFNGTTYEKPFYLADPTDILPTIENSNYCAGENLNVVYSIGSGTYSAGHIFTAQLSNASGSFASPTNIGAISSQNSGTISATIPSGTPAGTGYRIRVSSSLGVYIPIDNGYDIAIKQAPTATITGTTTIAPNQSATLSVALSGGAPYNVVLSDGKGKTFDSNSGSFVVSPSVSTTYTLPTLQNACGTGSGTGSAVVTVTSCPLTLSLANPADNYSTGTILKQASAAPNGRINATNQITTTGTRVTYQAKSILMSKGFKADKGTIFLAEIGGCN